MRRFIALLSSMTFLAGCGASTTPTTPVVVDEVVLPSLERIEFELYSSDGSKLAGAAKANQTLEVRGECALSDTTRKVSVTLVVNIVARSRDGRVTIHNSAGAPATGDDLSHLQFSATIKAPVQPGTYTIEAINTARQDQRAQLPLRVE